MHSDSEEQNEMNWRKMDQVERSAAIRQHCDPGHTAGQIADILSAHGMTHHSRHAVMSHMNRAMDGWWRGKKAAGKPPRPRTATETHRLTSMARRASAPGIKNTLATVTWGVHGDHLGSSQCKFPLWPHDAEPTHMYCGQIRTERSPYCPGHHRLCYEPVPPKTKPERKAA
jgi:hypothetical protein